MTGAGSRGGGGPDGDPDRLRELLADLDDRARRAGAFLIARHQRLRQRHVKVANGRLEDVATATTAGLGLHVFTRDGRSAFGAVDRVAPDTARALLDALVAAAGEASRRRYEANREVWSAGDTSVEVLPETRYPFDHLSLRALVRELRAVNRALAAEPAGARVETVFVQRVEDWTVTRSDGTVARFRMPRTTVANHATLGTGGGALAATAAVSSPSWEALVEPGTRGRLEARSRIALRRIAGLVSAPHVRAGSYPLVIDYALAKGLAHEAFGHASETDSFRSSVLARGGRLREGLEVAVPSLSIVDEPIYGDHAFQPVSANGVPRRRATLVSAGRLAGGLSDLFTARRAGVSPVGAARAESYRSIPLPRMTNIRIEMADARPLPRPFDELEPADVRDLLDRSGLLGRDPVAYLSGYRGGQVNTTRGDFVFNCGAIHLVSRSGVETFRPAIFSGHFLSALRAVRAGFGPLLLDAIGTCGKRGQQVPSSGGSNALLYLAPSDDVKIGGRP